MNLSFSDAKPVQVLSKNTINRIAAGEIVESPASVLKELVENALDSQATKISVYLENGGLNLIQIIDNGRGIPSNDLPQIYLRHATNKLSSIDDLKYLTTMGFRGEALSSISAVSEFTVESRYFKESLGQQLYINNGSKPQINEISKNIGTTVKVVNLFSQLPARKKFLGSANSELKKITNLMDKLTFPRADVSFKMYHNNKLILSLVENNILSRLASFYGIDKVQGMIEIDKTSSKLSLKGFVGHYDHCISNTSQQFFYVNQRYVQSPLLSKALKTAYGDLSQSSYPIAVLFLMCEGSLFDVNVHPSKKEIRFEHEYYISNFITETIRFQIKESLSLPQLVDANLDTKTSNKNSIDNEVVTGLIKPLNESISNDALGDEFVFNPIEKDTKTVEFKQKDLPQTQQLPISYFYFHSEFILFEQEDGLAIIHQQRAHQRILYETSLQQLTQKKHLTAQQLLFPEIIELTRTETQSLQDLVPFLKNIGFEIEVFGIQTFQLKSVPTEINHQNAITILKDIIHNLKNAIHKADVLVEISKAYAKYGSITSKEKLSSGQIQQLINNLFLTQNPYVSPFGKPVVWQYKLEEFYKKFKINEKP